MLLLCALVVGCGRREAGTGATTGGPAGGRSLTLAGFAVAREVYERSLLPAFQEQWAAEHGGERLRVSQSYEGSSAQARAIAAGLEADVAVLAMAPDIGRLVEAGLVRADWDAGPDRGIVATSTVVLAVRRGNPKGIRDWADLTRSDVEVITPNPDTSGAAQWNVAAIYGAVTQAGGTPAEAEEQVRAMRRRVKVFGKSGREAMQQFANGIGDVLVTWENEALQRREAGDPLEIVYPSRTLRMETPAAVVERWAEKNGNLEVARAFVEFLRTPEAQRGFAQHHFRPVDETVAGELADRFPAVPGLFTIDDLGGWKTVQAELFGPDGVWARAAR